MRTPISSANMQARRKEAEEKVQHTHAKSPQRQHGQLEREAEARGREAREQTLQNDAEMKITSKRAEKSGERLADELRTDTELHQPHQPETDPDQSERQQHHHGLSQQVQGKGSVTFHGIP